MYKTDSGKGGQKRKLTRGRSGEFHVATVFFDEPFDHVDLFQSELDGVQMLGLAGNVGRPKLPPDHSLSHSRQIRLRPMAFRPRRQIFQIGVQVKVSQSIVNEFSNVPREIVVAEKNT